MSTVPFPCITLPMSLKPASGGEKYFGSITLKTTSSGHKQIEILLDTGETGAADVTYTPIRADRGDIAAFNMTVYKADGTRHSQWKFGDIIVDNSDGTIYVLSDTLEIDGVPFEMAAIPKTGKPATAPWLDVVERRVVIGRLFSLTVGPFTLASFIALCSAALGRPIQSQMAIMGDMSLGGTVVQVRNLAESLQVAFDAGAKKLLLPMSSVGDIPSVPGELFAKFQTSFYSDPVDAVFKAIGVE